MSNPLPPRWPVATWAIGLVAAHSLLLGLTMLFAARLLFRVFGFQQPESLFYASQSGVFLLILGACYALAVTDRGFVKVIVLSKVVAVVFLLIEAGLLAAPPIIWAAGAGDAAMLVLVLAVCAVERRRAAAPLVQFSPP